MKVTRGTSPLSLASFSLPCFFFFFFFFFFEALRYCSTRPRREGKLACPGQHYNNADRARDRPTSRPRARGAMFVPELRARAHDHGKVRYIVHGDLHMYIRHAKKGRTGHGRLTKICLLCCQSCMCGMQFVQCVGHCWPVVRFASCSH